MVSVVLEANCMSYATNVGAAKETGSFTRLGVRTGHALLLCGHSLG